MVVISAFIPQAGQKKNSTMTQGFIFQNDSVSKLIVPLSYKFG